MQDKPTPQSGGNIASDTLGGSSVKEPNLNNSSATISTLLNPCPLNTSSLNDVHTLSHQPVISDPQCQSPFPLDNLDTNDLDIGSQPAPDFGRASMLATTLGGEVNRITESAEVGNVRMLQVKGLRTMGNIESKCFCY